MQEAGHAESGCPSKPVTNLLLELSASVYGLRYIVSYGQTDYQRTYGETIAKVSTKLLTRSQRTCLI